MTSGLETISERIMQKARAEADAILQAAAKERNDTITSANEEAEKSASQIMDAARTEADVRYEEKLGAIRTELRKQALLKREELINEAWEKAWHELRSYAKTPEYREALLDLVVRTADLVEGETFLVDANDRDLQTIGESRTRIEKSLKSAGTPKSLVIGRRIDCVGGIQGADAERRVVFDRTYEAKARRLKPSLRSELAHILAEGSE